MLSTNKDEFSISWPHLQCWTAALTQFYPKTFVSCPCLCLCGDGSDDGGDGGELCPVPALWRNEADRRVPGHTPSDQPPAGGAVASGTMLSVL